MDLARRVTGRAKLGYPITHCSRTLKRGEIKRVMPRGPLFIGYYIACPGCGFIAVYLHDEAAFVEEDASREGRGPFQLLGIGSARCVGCKAALGVEDGDLVSTVPA